MWLCRQVDATKRIRQKGFTISELLLVLAIVVLVAVLLMPVIRCSRRNMEKVVCTNNLQQVGLALYIYAREHEGKFPPSLNTLYQEHYLSDERFMDCPGTKEIGTKENPDYAYTAGLSVSDDSAEPLVADKRKNHRKSMKNVLYVNGTIEWTKEEAPVKK
ncbi:MAG: prepilin-type N-terminal cleavage/methylation domain-containing protein [Candidatus Omnitrophica bacterium]|nr:prepilin-type N-terminal cleavage/methylation domain-containing protein [Candidatus Omnitrophota bacterium]